VNGVGGGLEEPKEKGEKEKLGNLTSSNRSKHTFR